MSKNVCYILVFGPHVMEEEILQNLEPKADVAAQQCVSCIGISIICILLFVLCMSRKERISFRHDVCQCVTYLISQP